MSHTRPGAAALGFVFSNNRKVGSPDICAEWAGGRFCHMITKLIVPCVLTECHLSTLPFQSIDFEARWVQYSQKYRALPGWMDKKKFVGNMNNQLGSGQNWNCLWITGRNSGCWSQELLDTHVQIFVDNEGKINVRCCTLLIKNIFKELHSQGQCFEQYLAFRKISQCYGAGWKTFKVSRGCTKKTQKNITFVNYCCLLWQCRFFHRWGKWLRKRAGERI